MNQTDLEARVTSVEAQVAALRMVIEKLESRLEEQAATKRPKPIRASLEDQVNRSIPAPPKKRRPKPPRGPMLD